MTLRDRRLPTAVFGAALLALAACNGAPVDAAATSGDNAEPPAAAAKAAAPKTAPAAPDLKAPDLNAYVGKYPFDKVGGVAFSDHPLVKAGIAATVTDARVRTAITTTQGPSAPIEMIGGKVAAWSCQQHKCGEHQWMILVDPATGATDVCYLNDPAMVDESRWFLAGGTEEKRKGDCASEKS
ncbi:hypothetical protein FHR22_002430 [Sphingopyxis panaciterrae]|uniref:hypothetical protein n=1 Tax=Sphingopyxis panaciterrae TaxID=363841 RepID=UPI0014206218|nr:hypothetical protein [Sphingopyxis panaciterrae]NIJ37727.1 hypothetical protein [Sphingopyxis panaciterrae]